VRVRLDRAVASPDWSQCFPNAHVQHVMSANHNPIMLELELTMLEKQKSPSGTWEREPSLQDEIKKMWQGNVHGNSLKDIQQDLEQMRSSLKKWSTENFGSVTKELRRIRERIETLSNLDRQVHEVELQTLRTRMDETLHHEEMMWLQRLRVTWLKEGERNTKKNHMKAAGRAKKNRVTRLQRADGHVTHQRKEMEDMTHDF
jgi:hypothetical protein